MCYLYRGAVHIVHIHLSVVPTRHEIYTALRSIHHANGFKDANEICGDDLLKTITAQNIECAILDAEATYDHDKLVDELNLHRLD